MKTEDIMALVDAYTDSHLEMVMRGGVDPLIERDALQSAIEALRADAARYRWLRDSKNLGVAVVNWNIGHDWIDLQFEQLDAAIDAASQPDQFTLGY